MKKPELISDVSTRSGETKDTVRRVLDALRDSVHDALAAGAEVSLLGLGKLRVTERGEKLARNPHTGEKLVVPPRRVATFRPSDSVEHAINPGRSVRSHPLPAEE